MSSPGSTAFSPVLSRGSSPQASLASHEKRIKAAVRGANEVYQQRLLTPVRLYSSSRQTPTTTSPPALSQVASPKVVKLQHTEQSRLEKEKRSYDQRIQLFKEQVHLHRRSLTSSVEPVRKQMQTGKKIPSQQVEEPQ